MDVKLCSELMFLQMAWPCSCYDFGAAMLHSLSSLNDGQSASSVCCRCRPSPSPRSAVAQIVAMNFLSPAPWPDQPWNCERNGVIPARYCADEPALFSACFMRGAVILAGWLAGTSDQSRTSQCNKLHVESCREVERAQPCPAQKQRSQTVT